MAKKAKKPNPQDTTLRNLRAIKTRVAALERRMTLLEGRLVPNRTAASAKPDEGPDAHADQEEGS